MKRLIFVIVFSLIAMPVYAYELLMFSNKQCSYCDNFLKEVKPGYSTTIYAKRLPLRIIETSGDIPKWFEDAFQKNNIDSIQVTPTFVIWDDKENYEIARMEGYLSEKLFYEDIYKFSKAMGWESEIDLPSLHPEGSRHK